MNKTNELLGQAISIITDLQLRLHVPYEVLQAFESLRHHAANGFDYWSYVEDETECEKDCKKDAETITKWFYESFYQDTKTCFSYCKQCGNMLAIQPGLDATCKPCKRHNANLGYKVNKP